MLNDEQTSADWPLSPENAKRFGHDSGPRLPYACPGCGQMSDVQGRCDACLQHDRAPQGETVRLFAPAPTQLAGQLSFG